MQHVLPSIPSSVDIDVITDNESYFVRIELEMHISTQY